VNSTLGHIFNDIQSRRQGGALLGLAAQTKLQAPLD